MAKIVVAAALVRGDGAVLVQQRPPGGAHGGLWEFPGGKLEAGEALVEALLRELDEELGIAVEPDTAEPLAFSSSTESWGEILLLLYVCRRWRGTPRPRFASAIAWTTPAAMTDLAMPAADIPLVAALAAAFEQARQ